MKRKIIAITLCLIGILSLLSCSTNQQGVSVNVENDSSISGNVFGKSALIRLGNYLYYDTTTRIVYWWNGHLNGDYATTPNPYYAPNGLPYRYNPETNTFEEIDNTK